MEIGAHHFFGGAGRHYSAISPGETKPMTATWYVFADLDALNQDVVMYMRSHAKEFSDAELGKRFPISACKLTKLLSRPDGATKHFQGSYYYLKLKDVEAFRAAGWEMRPKPASKYRTLGHLPKPTKTGDVGQEESRTLVLVAGKVAVSVLHGVHKYFEAGWCIHCYCFRDRDAKIYDQLAADHPSHFQCCYLDKSVRSLIKEVSDGIETLDSLHVKPRDSQYGDAMKLSILYKHIHELQEKVLAMEAKSAAQSVLQHDDMHFHLQQQKAAFEYQLSKQDEDFQKRLQEHRKAATLQRKRHEEQVEKRVEECSSEVAAALLSLGDLSERVKHDVSEYQRARLDKELARWRRETTGNCIQTPTYKFQSTPVSSTVLDAVDVVLKQNGFASGVQNWRAALVMLMVHKITTWLSSASFGADLVGVVVTSMAVMVIAGCFAGAT